MKRDQLNDLFGKKSVLQINTSAKKGIVSPKADAPQGFSSAMLPGKQGTFRARVVTPGPEPTQ
jgi:hypothetical protein